MKALAELRQYIYDFLDVEVFDISEDLLNSWAKEGYDRIVKMARRLPHFESEHVVQTIPYQQHIDMPETLESIDWLTVGGRVLRPIDFREGYEEYVSHDGQPNVGEPARFSPHNGRIFFWPMPHSEREVVIQGWRKPFDWVAIAGTPDMPEEFESVLLSYMLYRAYGHQGLIEDQAVERAEFDSQITQLTSWEKEIPTQSPMILGGGKRRRSGPAPLSFPITMGP